MNIIAILAIIFYLSIIIIPLVLVIRETMRDIAKLEIGNEKKDSNKRS